MESSRSTCIICSSKKVETFKVTARDIEELELVKCNNCLHVYQPIEEYKDLYTSGEFSKVARNNSNVPSNDKIKSLDKKAFKRLEFYKGIISQFSNTLEIGSSIGSFISLLKLRGIEARGIEPDLDYAKFSMSQYGFQQDSALLENYNSDKKFDSLCSFHVLEHVKDPKEFIKKAQELLNENGQILFELPSMEVHSYGDLKFTYWSPHIHYFTMSSLYFLFTQFFEVKNIGFYGSALYVYAVKSSSSTFDSKEFSSLKKKSIRIKSLMNIFPSVPVLGKNKTFLRQMVVQPFLQKNVKEVFDRYYRIGSYHTIKDKLYLKKETNGSGGSLKAFHVSYYNLWENAGDTILSKCVRDNFNVHFKQKWDLERVTNVVTDKTINRINQSKYVVVGGGGLFLPDSNKNDVSGWQWAISKEQLEQIKVPLLIYSVGFNYFHGQSTNSEFVKNLNALVNRADFFGLRNLGSIERVKRLLRPELKEKVRWQPCTTTVIRKRLSNLANKPSMPTKKVAINMAFDRYEKRFEGNMHQVMIETAKAMMDLQTKGYQIYLVGHLVQDFWFGLSLEAEGVNFERVDLQYASPEYAYTFYNEMDIVFGARGHAQMVPFGVNTRIISLGSHNKVKFFLEDLKAGDWFIDLREDHETLRERIIDKFESVNEKNVEETNSRLLDQQDRLFDQTLKNFEIIKKILN
ncbi:methyltransferase domain-containing protein [Reichenbachiella versicolor]|uniref:methyltransferase domain-containing protein n=1 Tax=Reichenbachiella versicolor TaxID=1821036 RepID=UPI000D6E6723|nr:methyltransferase domain-containing protein [Reichenbachiella versicolor]